MVIIKQLEIMKAMLKTESGAELKLIEAKTIKGVRGKASRFIETTPDRIRSQSRFILDFGTYTQGLQLV